MTGEVTLQGRVLAIGGLKEKLLAAKQHKMTTIIIPHENKDDLEEIKKDIKLDGMDVIMVRSMDEVLKLIFFENPLANHPMRKTVKRTKQTVKKKK